MGDANFPGVTLTALGWSWLSGGDADWPCKKFSMMCEKFHIQCENPFFLNKIIKTWKTKFTVSSLVLCLVCPSVCPSHIYEKIFFWLFPSAAVDYFKGDTDCLGVMVTVLGLRILLMDDTNCSRITLTVCGWRWLALKKFPMLCEKFRIQRENVFFLNKMWKT